MGDFEQIQDGISVTVTMDEAIDPPEGAAVSDQQISEAVAEYLAANPLEDVIRAALAVSVTDAETFESTWWDILGPNIPAGVKVLTVYEDGNASRWTRGASGNAFIDEESVTVAGNLTKLVAAGIEIISNEAPYLRQVATNDPELGSFALSAFPLSPTQVVGVAAMIADSASTGTIEVADGQTIQPDTPAAFCSPADGDATVTLADANIHGVVAVANTGGSGDDLILVDSSANPIADGTLATNTSGIFMCVNETTWLRVV